MTRLQTIKQAMRNPPPDRLAKIEYQSHFLQIIGIIAVCVILIYKGFWWIIFALIFGVGVSYAQGVSALQKYKFISEALPKEKPKDFEKDISYTRRRAKIVGHVFGDRAPRVTAIVTSVFFALIFIDPTLSRWKLMLFYPIVILTMYIFLNIFLFYWIAYPMYKRKIQNQKGG